MRSTVTFRHPAELVVLSEGDGILGVEGAGWFLDLLRNIPGIELDRALRAAKASDLRWPDEGDRNLRDPAESPG